MDLLFYSVVIPIYFNFVLSNYMGKKNCLESINVIEYIQVIFVAHGGFKR